MYEKKDTAQMAELVRSRIALLREVAPGSIGDQMDFALMECDAERGEYVLRCKTFPWMRNAAGTLHGGMCATVVDQAMGLIAYCLMPGEGNAPTVQMQVIYHHPLIPGGGCADPYPCCFHHQEPDSSQRRVVPGVRAGSALPEQHRDLFL